MPWAGNIAKTMTFNGKLFTITRKMLTAVERGQRLPDVVAGRWNLSAFFKICFCFCNKLLNDWSIGEQWILFPSNLNASLDFVSGNKIHCSPRHQSVSVKYSMNSRYMAVFYCQQFWKVGFQLNPSCDKLMSFFSLLTADPCKLLKYPCIEVIFSHRLPVDGFVIWTALLRPRFGLSKDQSTVPLPKRTAGNGCYDHAMSTGNKLWRARRLHDFVRDFWRSVCSFDSCSHWWYCRK